MAHKEGDTDIDKGLKKIKLELDRWEQQNQELWVAQELEEKPALEDLDTDSIAASEESEDTYSGIADVEERIAAFFEARPYYYDQSHSEFKNKRLREAELEAFGSTIGWNGRQVWTRFISNRTEHVKLRNPRLKKNRKSTKMTNKQRFKLERYAFLDQYVVTRSWSDDMGKVSGRDEEEEAEDVNSEDLDEGNVNEGKRKAITQRAVKDCKRKRDLSEDHLDFDQNNRQSEMEAEEKTDGTLAAEPVCERESWGNWLRSAALAVPTNQFRAFQRETFEVIFRFLTPPIHPGTGKTMNQNQNGSLGSLLPPPKPKVQPSYIQPSQNQSHRCFQNQSAQERPGRPMSTPPAWMHNQQQSHGQQSWASCSQRPASSLTSRVTLPTSASSSTPTYSTSNPRTSLQLGESQTSSQSYNLSQGNIFRRPRASGDVINIIIGGSDHSSIQTQPESQ